MIWVGPKYNKYKCKCGAEAEGVNDVDASRNIVHKDGCTGALDNIELVSKYKEPEHEAEPPKKKK